MKLKLFAVCVLCVPFSLAWAEEEPKMPEHHGMTGKMNLEHLKEKQANMLAMHALSNQILAEKDPKKQQALKDQQLEMMKAHIADRMARHKQHKEADKK